MFFPVNFKIFLNNKHYNTKNVMSSNWSIHINAPNINLIKGNLKINNNCHKYLSLKFILYYQDYGSYNIGRCPG